jgi:hypothetical protein
MKFTLQKFINDMTLLINNLDRIAGDLEDFLIKSKPYLKSKFWKNLDSFQANLIVNKIALEVYLDNLKIKND